MFVRNDCRVWNKSYKYKSIYTVPILFEDKFTKNKIPICKGKIVPVLNEVLLHENVWEGGGIAPCILNFSNRWR
jgi:hypothetical protein